MLLDLQRLPETGITVRLIKLLKMKMPGRFTRHLNVISINSFDDETLKKIFGSITDWHFGRGFDSCFGR